MGSSSPLGSLRAASDAPLRAAPRPAPSRALRRFTRHRMAVAGAVFLAAVVLIAVTAPISAPYR